MDLYDEFGNYIGPDVDSDADSHGDDGEEDDAWMDRAEAAADARMNATSGGDFDGAVEDAEEEDEDMEDANRGAITLAEDGLVWNMRILNDGALSRKYGYSEAASAAAPEKIVEIIALMDAYLEQQAERGSKYLVGDAVTAADIYWATMSMCVTATEPDIMPVTRQNQGMLKYFASNSKRPEIAEVLSHRITDHQRYILTTYCETPAVLGGDPI